MCGARTWRDTPKVVRTSDGHAAYRGLAHCKNKLACPVCLDFAMSEYRNDVHRLCDGLKDRGGVTFLVTYTVRHGSGDEVATLRTLLSMASRKLLSGSGWKAIAKRIGYLGQVRTVEVTHGEANGYHPHIHSLFFVEHRLTPEQITDLQRSLYLRWVSCVADANIKLGADFGLPSFEHGVRVDYGGNAADYVLKMGLGGDEMGRGRRLAAEVSDQGDKAAAEGHRTMSEVAFTLAVLRANRLWEAAAYEEWVFRTYVEGLRGFKPVWIPPGLAAKIDRLALVVPPELANNAVLTPTEPEEPEEVIEFTDAEWAIIEVFGPHVRAGVLELVEAGGEADHVREYLRDVERLAVRVPDGQLFGRLGDFVDAELEEVAA